MAIVRNTDSLTIHGVDIKTILGGSRYRIVFARQTDGVGIFNRAAGKPRDISYRKNIEAAEAKLKMLGLRKGIDYSWQEYDAKKKKNLGLWIRPCRNKFGTARHRQQQLRDGERMRTWWYKKPSPCTQPPLVDRGPRPQREEVQPPMAAAPTPVATPGWHKAAWLMAGAALSYAAYTYLLPMVG